MTSREVEESEASGADFTQYKRVFPPSLLQRQRDVLLVRRAFIHGRLQVRLICPNPRSEEGPRSSESMRKAAHQVVDISPRSRGPPG
jgi:hypothetical protein